MTNNSSEQTAERSRETTNNYGWSSADIPESQQFVYSRLLSLVEGTGGMDILDVGCGNGYFCGRMAEKGIRPVGVDADLKGIEIARAHYRRIPFHHSTVADAMCVFAEASFDVVVSSEVIEHLYMPGDLPKLASHVLRPRGMFLVTTPYHGYFKNLVLSLGGAWDRHHSALRDGGHIKFWSRKTLVELLKRNGFHTIHCEGAGRCPLFWKTLIVMAQKQEDQDRCNRPSK